MSIRGSTSSTTATSASSSTTSSSPRGRIPAASACVSMGRGASGSTEPATSGSPSITARSSITRRRSCSVRGLGLEEPVAGQWVRVGTGSDLRRRCYDASRDLVIDPVLVYSTYLGGAAGWDGAEGIAVDGSGAAYVAGYRRVPRISQRRTLCNPSTARTPMLSSRSSLPMAAASSTPHFWLGPARTMPSTWRSMTREARTSPATRSLPTSRSNSRTRQTNQGGMLSSRS